MGARSGVSNHWASVPALPRLGPVTECITCEVNAGRVPTAGGVVFVGREAEALGPAPRIVLGAMRGALQPERI
jgi:hypothetical protein